MEMDSRIYTGKRANPSSYLPACIATGDITIEGIKYKSAIFLSLPTIQQMLDVGEWGNLDEALNELVEHEIIHYLIDWKHERELMSIRS